jgi:hypothetical protein
MSRKFSIVLPDPADQHLRELAAATDQAFASLASQMVQNEVAAAAENGHVRPQRQAPAIVRHKGEQRAPWLEPYGGDPNWRNTMWVAVVALHGRYPRHLQYLKDQWWTDDATTEALCALAAWRQEIDDTGQDPRDELTFHHQLTDYSDTLRKQGSGITEAWKPATAPDAWLSP